MILKQSKMLNEHPDLLKLRRGLVEKSLWVVIVMCFLIIGLLSAAVFYYKIEAEQHLPQPINNAFNKIGGKYLASVVASKMNLTANPCDDFYNFACGRFEKTVIIPDDGGSVNTINLIEGRVIAQLHTLLNSDINEKLDIRPFKMAKTFYRQCMNTSEIEKSGLDFVKQKLNLTTHWPLLMPEADWNETIWEPRDFNRYLVDLFIDSDLKNATNRILYINGANLGLSRDMLLKGFSDSVIRAYHNYMVNVSVHLGAERGQAERDFEQVLLFEMLLANITIPKEDRRDSNKLYNLFTIEELIEKYPYIDWMDFLNAKMLSGLRFNETDTIILQQPTYYDQLEDIINRTDKRIIASYIIWRDICDYIPYLTADLRNFEFEFMRAITGKAQKQARWTDCIKLSSSMFNIAISSMYVRENFRDERIRTEVGQIYNEIQLEFEKILHTNQWMDEATKSEALMKLKAMHANIAFPIELMNDTLIEKYYENLKLNETNYLQSALNVDTHGKEFICSRFHLPVNRSDWIDYATTIYVNANYNGKGNSIQIIAAMLQGHFFAGDRPNYMNYGGVGYVIGHELTHGFDDLGRLYNAEGNLAEWWHPETKRAYLEKTQCIIEQYGNYSDKTVNMSLNGVNTQGENIADNGGLKLAYLAYVSSMHKSIVKDPLLPGLPYNAEQLFWISAAQTWCSVERPEVKRILIANDAHAPGQFRVLGTLTNSKEFSADFKCAIGTPMNPVQKCEVW